MIQPIINQDHLRQLRAALAHNAGDRRVCPNCRHEFIPTDPAAKDAAEALLRLVDAPLRLLYKKVEGSQVLSMTIPLSSIEDLAEKANAIVALTEDAYVTHNFFLEEYQGPERGWVQLDIRADIANQLLDL